MGRKASVLAAALIAATHVGAVEPLVIDDFSAGPGFGVVLTPAFPNDTVVTNDTGLPAESVLGGTRWHRFQSCLSSGAMSVVHDPSAGVYQAGGSPDSTFCEGPAFEYDADGEGLDADVSDYNAVRIDLLRVDGGAPRPWWPEGESPRVFVGLNDYFFDVGRSFSASDDPTSVVIPFAALRDSRSDAPAGFDQVDRLTVSFGRLGQGGEIVIDGFSFVALPTLDGDFNGDGAVSSGDYELFRLAYGADVAPGTVADGNGDGVIDAADYTVWRDAFERDGAVAVPEPASASVALAAMGFGHRSRRQFA